VAILDSLAVSRVSSSPGVLRLGQWLLLSFVVTDCALSVERGRRDKDFKGEAWTQEEMGDELPKDSAMDL